ncbi:MAG TPA: tetratricopeptide repeat protein [Kofleriaceae bacterium]|jgi:tetratricopeptide (TPR) repeat protein
MGDSTSIGLGTAETIADTTGETLAESRTDQDGPRDSSPADHEPARGDAIGRFVVLGLLGSGGMGLVYSAYDPHLDRKVAIKLLRRSSPTTTDDPRARLLREAQAMAKIDHPNVVRVHEAGMYGEQIYVAMEFVDAGTLRTWLKERRTLREIIDVFAKAGRGLAAAHAVGLVHRDFKPDNVLMASDGGVRVTDFGIVGVLQEQAVAEQPAAAPEVGRADTYPPIRDSAPMSQDLTRTGSIMGTPSYMAPEQFNGQTATAQSDQFSFCIALYEAVYGARPFHGSTFGELAVSVTEGKLEPAPKQATVPSWLRRLLVRGLATDPAQRFPSLDALLATIARSSNRRRRRAAWLAAAVAVIAAGGGAAAWHARSSGPSCDGGDELARIWNPAVRMQLHARFLATGSPLAATMFATTAERLDLWGDGWKTAYTDVCRDSRHTRHVVDLRARCVAERLDTTGAMIDQLDRADADTVEHAVDAVVHLPTFEPCEAAAVLTSETPIPDTQVASVQAHLVSTELLNARAVHRLGRDDEALPIARRALSVARSIGYAPVIAEALLDVALFERSQGVKASDEDLHAALDIAIAAGDDKEAIEATAHLVEDFGFDGHHDESLRELRDLMDALVEHAHPDAELMAEIKIVDAFVDEVHGNLPAAQAGYEHAVAFIEKEVGSGNFWLDSALDQLGNLLKVEGKLDEAQHALERALALREKLYGKDHPWVAAELNNLGNVYRVQAKFDDAKRLYDRALAIRLEAYGPVSHDVGVSYLNLGTFYSERGDNATARTYYEKALAIDEQISGSDSDDVASASQDLGSTMISLGEVDEGRARVERAITIYSTANPNDTRVAVALSNLADADMSEGKWADALAKNLHAAAIAQAAYGPDHPDVGEYLTNTVGPLQHLHRLDEALATQLRANVILEKAFGPDHPITAAGLASLADVQREKGELAAAMATNRKSIAILEAHDKNDPNLADPLLSLGKIFDSQHRFGDALPDLERALALREAASAGPASLAEIHLELATALLPTAKPRARAEAQQAASLFTRAKRVDDAKVAQRWLAQHR